MPSMKFHSKPVYDEKYIKTKIKKFNDIAHKIFWNNEIPSENVNYTYIAAISTNFVMKIDKKNYSQAQVYLEE